MMKIYREDFLSVKGDVLQNFFRTLLQERLTAKTRVHKIELRA